MQQQWNLGLPGGPRWAGCGAGLAFPHVFFIKTNGTHASSGGAAAALEQRRKKLPAQKTFCTLYFPAKFSVSLTALGSLKKRPGAALPLTGVCPEQPLLGICLGTRVSPPITVRLASFLFTNRTQFNDDLYCVGGHSSHTRAPEKKRAQRICSCCWRSICNSCTVGHAAYSI